MYRQYPILAVSTALILLGLLAGSSSEENYRNDYGHNNRHEKDLRGHRRQGQDEDEDPFPEVRPEWEAAWPNPRQMEDLKNAIILTLLDRVAGSFQHSLPPLVEEYVMSPAPSLPETRMRGLETEEGKTAAEFQNPAKHETMYGEEDQNYAVEPDYSDYMWKKPEYLGPEPSSSAHLPTPQNLDSSVHHHRKKMPENEPEIYWVDEVDDAETGKNSSADRSFSTFLHGLIITIAISELVSKINACT
jgi:hypothetical protein